MVEENKNIGIHLDKYNIVDFMWKNPSFSITFYNFLESIDNEEYIKLIEKQDRAFFLNQYP